MDDAAALSHLKLQGMSEWQAREALARSVGNLAVSPCRDCTHAKADHVEGWACEVDGCDCGSFAMMRLEDWGG